MLQKNHQLDSLVKEQMWLQFEEAQQADTVGYYNRVLCHISLPVSKVPGGEYEREAGPHHLWIGTPSKVGIPYGRYPRGILSYLTTEVVVKGKFDDGSRTVYLGKDLTEFMQNVSGGTAMSGGKNGNITRFQRQLKSLLMSRIMYWTGDKGSTDWDSMEIAPKGHLFWNPTGIQRGLVDSNVQLSEVFWNHCTSHKVAIDLRALRGLWRFGCLAMDVYVWLTYKAFASLRLGRNRQSISWSALKFQFGPQYKRERKFKEDFKDALLKVRQVYSGFSVSEWEEKGITFHFARPSVLPKDSTIKIYPTSSLPAWPKKQLAAK